MDTLKPCPFCGSEAEYRVYRDNGCAITIGCTDRFCWCRRKRNLGLRPEKDYVEYVLQEMIESWNHRKE